jgi:hypothetical protein
MNILYIAAHNKIEIIIALLTKFACFSVLFVWFDLLMKYSNDWYIYFRFQTMIDSVKRELHSAKVQLSNKSS